MVYHLYLSWKIENLLKQKHRLISICNSQTPFAALLVSHPLWRMRKVLIIGLTPERSCLLGLKSLERVDFDVLDKGVELLLGLLVLVSLSGNSDADSTGDVPDASGPDLSVKKGVNAHFLYSVTNTKYKVLLHPFKNSTALATPEGAVIGAVREEPNPLSMCVKSAFGTGDGACGSIESVRDLLWCASQSG